MAQIYPQTVRFLPEPELIEAMAATTLTLYRAVIMSERLNSHGTWLQALDKDLFNPAAGDLVMDVREEWRPALERVGFLHYVMRETPVGVVALIQRLDGHFVAWQDARLVKVYLRPFGAASVMTGQPGAAAADDITFVEGI